MPGVRRPRAQRRADRLVPDAPVAGHRHARAGMDDDRTARTFDLDQRFGKRIGDAVRLVGAFDDADGSTLVAQKHRRGVLSLDLRIATLGLAGDVAHLSDEKACEVEHMDADVGNGQPLLVVEVWLRPIDVEAGAEANARPARLADRAAVDDAVDMAHRALEAEV